MVYTYLFFKALGLTVLIEAAVALTIKKFWARRLKIDVDNVRFVILVTLASVLTLPYVWFVIPAFISDKLAYVLFSEVSVFLLEAIFYKYCFNISLKTAFVLSLLANAVSYLIGVFLF